MIKGTDLLCSEREGGAGEEGARRRQVCVRSQHLLRDAFFGLTLTLLCGSRSARKAEASLDESGQWVLRRD